LKKVNAVEFDPLDYLAVFNVLKEICKKEKVDYDEATLKTLARQVDGDLRAAINDIQSLSLQKEKITMKSLEVLGYRNKQESIQDALVKIFKVKNAEVAKDALNSVHEDLDQVMLWVDHNLPKEYTKPESLARAYDKLSRADVFRGRIRRWQHWRFLAYVNVLISAGVAVSKDERNKDAIVYERTKRLLKIWMAKQKYAKREAIASKIAAGTHCSTKYCVKHVVPYVKSIFQNNKEMADIIAEEFELDSDEVNWLKKI